MKEFTFTYEELINALKELSTERGKLYMDSVAACEFVAKITDSTYDEVYRAMENTPSEKENDENDLWYEVDLRSRITGWTEETIYSGHDCDEAYRVAREWNKEHSGLDIDIEDREEYVDGSDGVFADVYENCEPHGVGLW